MSKPTLWPTRSASPAHLRKSATACVDRGRLLDVLLGDAVELLADDRSPGLDEGRPAILDLAVWTLTAPISTIGPCLTSRLVVSTSNTTNGWLFWTASAKSMTESTPGSMYGMRFVLPTCSRS